MQIRTIRYNARSGAFEARVDVTRNGRTYRYPCEVRGPVTLDLDDVKKCLAMQAARMSDTGTNLFSTF